MAAKLIRPLTASALLMFLLANPADLSSCGPFFESPVFTGTIHPDGSGLGIIQPTYARRYLVGAYRELTGLPSPVGEPHGQDLLQNDPQAAMELWLDSRKQVLGSQAAQIELYRRAGTYNSIPSCLADAFLNARQVLQEYIGKFGKHARQTHDWLAAQDQVFVNCGDSSALPQPASPAENSQIRSDRAYQIAAAYFYSGAYDRAKAAFEQIAADGASRWHALAPYLIARTYLRQGDYAAAQRQLTAILSKPAPPAIHPAAASLLDYTLAHLDPGAQLLTISHRLLQPASRTFEADLRDYTFLYSRFTDPYIDYSDPGYTPDKGQDQLKTSLERLRSLASKDALTDWIYTFQTTSAQNGPQLFERWKANGSMPWLVTALYYATGKDSFSGDLVAAAVGLPGTSPAFPTARFEGVRLLVEAGETERARSVLDEILQAPASSVDPSDLNAFRAERMKVAEAFPVFLVNAQRVIRNYNKTGQMVAFDADGTDVFNRNLPLSHWLEAVRSGELNRQLRTELAQAGWVRAVMIGEDEAAFASELVKLKPAYAAALRVIDRASDKSALQFEAVYWILHHPELQPWIRSGYQRTTADGKIDDFRDNWWCTPNTAESKDNAFNYYGMQSVLTGILPRLYPTGQRPAANFLAPTEQRSVSAEQERLAHAGSAPNFLSSAVVAWAGSHPSDSRNPEALALALKTSRFGYTDSKSGPVLRRAFEMLHLQYGSSEWAHRTPYWYQ
ncbi:MAG: hypothetical protein M3Y72_16655 [Acidobacteriota bacterium]|nr:hypothetical protein [Acidobacteriota bacterium]